MKLIFKFHEIPHDIKNLVSEKCLEKNAEIIADAIPIPRQPQPCNGIHITGGQTAKPAVPKACIPFHLFKDIEVKAKI